MLDIKNRTMNKKRITWNLISLLLLLTLPNVTQPEISTSVSTDHTSGSSQIEALKDNDPNVRSRAAEELGKQMNAGAVEPLIHVLIYDDVWSVRKSAAWALGEIKDAKAVLPLIRALGHRDWIIRLKAAEALGKIGNTAAVAALMDSVEDENDHVIEKVIWALGELRDRKAVEQLLGTLKNRLPAVRISTSQALGKIKDSRTVMPLIEALENESSWEVKKSILWALGEINDRHSLPAMVNALGDENYYVRLHAEIALEKTGCRAVPFLIPVVHDTKFEARTRAVWTLEKITGQHYGRDTDGWEKWLLENEGCALKTR